METIITILIIYIASVVLTGVILAYINNWAIDTTVDGLVSTFMPMYNIVIFLVLLVIFIIEALIYAYQYIVNDERGDNEGSNLAST